MSELTHFIYFGEIKSSVIESLKKLEGKVLVQAENKLQIDKNWIDTEKMLISDTKSIDNNNSTSYKTLGMTLSDDHTSFDRMNNDTSNDIDGK
jgi:hypothetical protein